ncbi:peptidylprolyl isomerase [Lichenihabitans sp. Uapishka_5]|uniref:peptidylprolyl isomerase n=1 Tax=Lichenihabitans sp. Uapishka_5 TaxID=3037302 RepID=UPI0029E7ED0D|nr:peptidylprolyl isomerase [Lichenihabitans sp. Uapishka_5]MDX7951605.1 peptidylprolyl isomerase [Lichenihabitans sp. Uapishka_5]
MTSNAQAAFRLLAATALVGLASPQPAWAAKVLATVNGQTISDDDVKTALDDLGPNLPAQLKGPQRDAYALDYLIDLRLVAAQASKDKLAETPEFAQKMAYYHDKILMETMLGNVAKTAATDQAEHKVYDDAAKAKKPEEEIHARHILVPTEAEAKAAFDRVNKGEDFAKVADEVSKDPGSQGGDLGWFTRDKMVPEFAEAAFKLEPGQVSQPVKSEFGWHVIKLEGKREKSFPAFDQVKDQVSRYVVQKAQSDLVMDLRKDAKIERTAAAPPPVPADGVDAGAPADAAPAAAPATPAPAPADAPKP